MMTPLGTFLIGLSVAVAAPLVWTWVFVLSTHGRWVRYMRHTGRALPDRTLLAWLGVWWREVRNLLWTQSFHLTVLWADRPTPVDAPTGPPVLCVHGFTQNGSNFRRIRRQLAKLGRPSASITMGYPPRTLDRYAARLAHRLHELLEEHDSVDIVAHSMGGIVLRRVLELHPEIAARIGRIVTLASPHHGTGAARGVPLPETRFMARRSTDLDRLPSLVALAPHSDITTIGATADTTVYPLSTTRQEGAPHIDLPDLGHGGILVDGAAVEVTVQCLTAPRRTNHDEA